MSRKITTVISFKIESKYEEWGKIFESKESDLRNSEFDMKQLFNGFIKDDPKKSSFHASFTRGEYSKVCTRK